MQNNLNINTTKHYKIMLGFLVTLGLSLTLMFTIMHPNLQLDAAEIIAWGQEWQWGGQKHPAFPAWFLQVFMQILPNNIASYYLVGQIAMAITYIFVWLLAREILNPTQALLATIILACAMFYSFCSLTYNANILSLLAWAAFNFCLWKALNDQRKRWWIALAIAATAAILSKYAAMLMFIAAFTTMIIIPEWRKLLKTYKPYIAIAIVAVLTTPHWWWVADNNYTTIQYALGRFEAEKAIVIAPFYPHIYFPLRFAYGQIFNMLPMLMVFAVLMPWKINWLYFAIWKNKKSNTVNKKNEKQKSKKQVKVFLLTMGLMPFAITMTISVLFGKYIHSLWGLFYWNLAGISLFYFFGHKIIWARLKKSIAIWAFFVIATTFGFLMVLFIVPTVPTTGQKNHNTNIDEIPETKQVSPARNRRLLPYFGGEYLAKFIENEWQKKGYGKIKIAAGHSWLAGNVAFFSDDRPSVFNDLNETKSAWLNIDMLKQSGGVVLWHAENYSENNKQNEKYQMPPKYKKALQGKNYQLQKPIAVPWHKILGAEPYRVRGLQLPKVGWAIIPPS